MKVKLKKLINTYLDYDLDENINSLFKTMCDYRLISAKTYTKFVTKTKNWCIDEFGNVMDSSGNMIYVLDDYGNLWKVQK